MKQKAIARGAKGKKFSYRRFLKDEKDRIRSSEGIDEDLDRYYEALHRREREILNAEWELAGGEI